MGKCCPKLFQHWREFVFSVKIFRVNGMNSGSRLKYDPVLREMLASGVVTPPLDDDD